MPAAAQEPKEDPKGYLDTCKVNKVGSSDTLLLHQCSENISLKPLELPQNETVGRFHGTSEVNGNGGNSHLEGSDVGTTLTGPPSSGIHQGQLYPNSQPGSTSKVVKITPPNKCQ